MGKIAVAVIVGIWIIPIAIMVNKVVPDPYMDEIFHIPQARQYCRGDLMTWDPMITTPPGLYYVSLMYVTSLFPGMWFATNEAQSITELCSTSYLRSTNAFLAIICSVLVYELIINLKPSYSERKATLFAVVMALYPVHWFFTFLYYTDVASVTAVMAMLLASLKKNYRLSAMFGAIAILFRQTNVVWMLFVAADGAIRYDDFYLKEQARSSGHNTRPGNDNNGHYTVQTLRRRTLNISQSREGLIDSEVIENEHTTPTDFFSEIIDITVKLWHLKGKVLLTFAPFLMAMVAFVAFVIWNGSIVLGAKEDHVASLHVAQMMYFALVSAAALGPLHFSLWQARKLFKSFRKDRMFASTVVLVALLVGFISVHLSSIEHKYLIADNRHYTFYVWRRVIKSHKYLLVPIYIYSWISIVNILAGKARRKIWVFLFICTTAMVLIPAPLIEFRYYTIPFFILFLHSEIEDDMKLFFIGCLYVLVDVFTMAMFLFRPFNWDHEPGVQQRFIW